MLPPANGAVRHADEAANGTPADRKPINSGTAEHEQNGVIMPGLAARTLPTPILLPASRAQVRSGAKNVCTMLMTNTIAVSSSEALGVIHKKAHDFPRPSLAVQAGQG